MTQKLRPLGCPGPVSSAHQPRAVPCWTAWNVLWAQSLLLDAETLGDNPWLRPLEPETPGAEIWGGQCWKGRLVEAGTLGS